LRLQFLGTGAAQGIPAMGCECAHCSRARQEGGRLEKRRSSVLFFLPGYELLMDTPPDIRELLDAGGVQTISGVFLSHEHFDHVGGLEEFLYWQKDIDLFTEAQVYQRLIRVNWAKQLPDIAFHFGIRPGTTIHFHDFSLTPFGVPHKVPCCGFVLSDGQRRVVHAADSGPKLSNYARCLLEGADMLILSTPFFYSDEDETHMGVDEAVALKDEVGAKQLILTHVNHFNKPHDKLEAYVAQYEGVTVAYDGLVLDL
jgi:phosphoribosyl 1,2-cyclic phosphate phosphodiesterase